MAEIYRNPDPDSNTHNWEATIDIRTPNGTTAEGRVIVKGNTKRQVQDKCMDIIHELFNTIDTFGDEDENVRVQSKLFVPHERNLNTEYPTNFYREEDFAEEYDLEGKFDSE